MLMLPQLRLSRLPGASVLLNYKKCLKDAAGLSHFTRSNTKTEVINGKIQRITAVCVVLFLLSNDGKAEKKRIYRLTAVSTKVVPQKCKSVRDNADWHYG